MTSPPASLHWDDLGVCLAIAESGSILAAAQRIGCSHSTILRRLDRLEASLGARLFDRYGRGAKPTDTGREFIGSAQEIARRIDELATRTSGANARMKGRLRLATADQIGAIIMDEISRFCSANPEIGVDATIAQNVKSASQSKAHLIVMLSDAPPEGHTGYRIGEVAFAPYVSRAALEATPIEDFAWVAHAPSLRFTFQGQLDRALSGRMGRRHSTDSISAHLNAIRAGLGAGLVACGLGDVDAALVRCGPMIRPRNAELWVLHRADVSRDGATRALARRLKDVLIAQRNRLAGLEPLYDAIPHPALALDEATLPDERFVKG